MSAYAVLLTARMDSSRLPGKSLCNYGAGPNLAQIIRRWRSSERQPTIVVTTTNTPADDPIGNLCKSLGVPCHRGHPTNVIVQMHAALMTYAGSAQYVARALGDNPLVDVELADWRLDVLEESGADGLWYGGAHDRITYAGTTDVWSRSAWERIIVESSGSQLAHPGVQYWDSIGSYHAAHLPLPRCEYLAPVRTELDTLADLEMLRCIWAAWGKPDTILPTRWALSYLALHPEVAAINADVQRATQSAPVFRNHWRPWLCRNCNQRMGSLVSGDLRVFCPGCGEQQTYYAVPPDKHHKSERISTDA